MKASGSNPWAFVIATPVIMWLVHYLAYLPHEYAHSVTAWIVGIKPQPGNITWGDSSLINIMLATQVDENVDYSAALAAGKDWQVALVAFAGPGLGNAVPYLVCRWLIFKDSIAARPWVAYILLWYVFFGLANIYDYIPMRMFTDGGDVHHFLLGSGISEWLVYGIVGNLAVLAIVDFYRSVLPFALGVAGFRQPSGRAGLRAHRCDAHPVRLLRDSGADRARRHQRADGAHLAAHHSCHLDRDLATQRFDAATAYTTDTIATIDSSVARGPHRLRQAECAENR
ncbi:hypothetical protein [Nakamurella deserti]|uniref:hypothetical protein n=1 Tax=Nakamurella deserti TaxID=2164074 RepID=UPI000DBE32DA|nr:hypothetical protein [Nakamurella deserti]